MQLEDEIRGYLSKNLLFVEDGFDYDNDTSFIAEGLIDSMGVIELVAYVQSSFGISVEQREVTPENFDSVNKLAGFIRSKSASHAYNGGLNGAGSTRARGHQVAAAD